MQREKKQKHDFNNSSARVKSPHKQKKEITRLTKKKQMPQLIGSRQYAPKKKKKLSARTISKQCGLASAHGARGRKRAQRVNNGGFAETPSLLSSRTVCVCLSVFEVQKTIADYPSLSPFSLSLTCYSRLLLQTSTLQHGCAALNLQMAHAPHISSQVPPFFPSSSHQLSRNEEFECR